MGEWPIEEFQIQSFAVIVSVSIIFGLQITCHFIDN